MATELKIAIVGLGVIGKVHAAALKEQGKTLYAVCDTDPKLLAEVDARAKSSYVDVYALLERFLAVVL